MIHGRKAMLPEIVLEKNLSSLLPASGDTRCTSVPAVLVLNLSLSKSFSHLDFVKIYQRWEKLR